MPGFAGVGCEVPRTASTPAFSKEARAKSLHGHPEAYGLSRHSDDRISEEAVETETWNMQHLLAR
jgi:hypothetical protein